MNDNRQQIHPTLHELAQTAISAGMQIHLFELRGARPRPAAESFWVTRNGAPGLANISSRGTGSARKFFVSANIPKSESVTPPGLTRMYDSVEKTLRAADVIIESDQINGMPTQGSATAKHDTIITTQAELEPHLARREGLRK